MHVYIIGTGPGNPALLTGQAKAAIEASPILVGDKRMLAPFAASGKRLVATYRRDDICQLAASLSDEEGPMAVLVSGDVGFFSLAALLTDIPGCTVTRIAGISSLVYFAATPRSPSAASVWSTPCAWPPCSRSGAAPCPRCWRFTSPLSARTARSHRSRCCSICSFGRSRRSSKASGRTVIEHF